MSDPTTTQIGRFKKDKNSTKYSWNYRKDDDYLGPSVDYDIAMETLKNSSLQMILKIDRNFSVQQTDLVI